MTQQQQNQADHRRYPVLVDGQEHVEAVVGKRIPVPAGATECELVRIKNHSQGGGPPVQVVTVRYLRPPTEPDAPTEAPTEPKRGRRHKEAA